jgi:hypothetical protein
VKENCTDSNGACVDKVCQLSKFHSIKWLFIVDFELTFVANVRFCHYKTSNVRQSVI